MQTDHARTPSLRLPHGAVPAVCIMLGLAAFGAPFVVIDQAYYTFASARFPPVGASTWLATLWGLVSRAHLLAVLIPLAIWRPAWLGLRGFDLRRHGCMLLLMLAANVGVIAAYLWLTGSSTPYSANQWFLTEVVSVPLVEETFWRGIVFAVVLALSLRFYSEKTSLTLTVWSTGLVFGALHAANALAGVPLAFAALQALNAAVWGVVYGYARARTGSVYPPILLHAAMNLVVVLF
jgi:membrane protease YdiL (CAAX protease family)